MKLSDFDDDETPTGIDALKDWGRRIKALDCVLETLHSKISKILKSSPTDKHGKKYISIY